jgi:hypothetical protein
MPYSCWRAQHLSGWQWLLALQQDPLQALKP